MDDWSNGFSVMVERENFEEVLFGPHSLFFEGASFRSLIMSDVRMLKKPCAIELKMVIFCSRFYLIEFVL